MHHYSTRTAAAAAAADAATASAFNDNVHVIKPTEDNGDDTHCETEKVVSVHPFITSVQRDALYAPIHKFELPLSLSSFFLSFSFSLSSPLSTSLISVMKRAYQLTLC